MVAMATMAASKQPSVPIVLRTRLYDEALLRPHGATQAVISAAGMDARSYRPRGRSG
jgi:O-methyltransferase involved in polyketide biosynthesis